MLKAENINWPEMTLNYCRQKTGTPASITIGRKLEAILKALPALGHNSKAVHRAYARKARVKVPSLEEYEKNVA